MPRKKINKICKNCGTEFVTRERNPQYCSKSCAVRVNNSKRGPMSEEQKKKISESLKKIYTKQPERLSRGQKHAQAVAKYTRGKYREYPPESILKLSRRTVGKIFKRMKLECSICGWNECVCDIHHINGRNIDNADSHKNLTYVCPNCHRKIHNNLINQKNIVDLEQYIGDKWKQFYYG